MPEAGWVRLIFKIHIFVPFPLFLSFFNIYFKP